VHQVGSSIHNVQIFMYTNISPKIMLFIEITYYFLCGDNEDNVITITN